MTDTAISLEAMPFLSVFEKYVLHRPENATRIQTLKKILATSDMYYEIADFFGEVPLGPSRQICSPYRVFRLCVKPHKEIHPLSGSICLNELLLPYLTWTLEKLRSGCWVAEGTKFPPSHELPIIEVPKRWWSRDDTVLQVSTGSLIFGTKERSLSESPLHPQQQNRPARRSRSILNFRRHTMFTDIHIRDCAPQQRIQTPVSISETVVALADPPDRPGLKAYLSRGATRHDSELSILSYLLLQKIQTLLVEGKLQLALSEKDKVLGTKYSAGAIADAELDPYRSTVTLKYGLPQKVLICNSNTLRTGRPRRRRGATSRSPEMLAAFNDLFEHGSIELRSSKAAIYDAVREKVFQNAGNRNKKGLSDDTIASHLSDRIDRERENRKIHG